MANEWKWCQFNWSQATDNSQVLMNRIETFLLASGWVLAPYSDLDDRYYIRADHGSSDIWHYTGDGPIQRCGLYIRDNRYNGGAYTGTQQLVIRAFLENILENNIQVASPVTTADILINFHATKDHTITLIGGEDGLEVEFGVDGVNGNIALGMVFTHQVWTEMNGTRTAERKFASQGLVMDWFGIFRMTINRNYRLVRDDGTNLNATAYIHLATARSNFDVTTGGIGISNGTRMPLINWEHQMAMDIYSTVSGRSGGSGFDTGCQRCTLGVMSTPFDDRWRMSPLVYLQSRSGAIAAHTFSGDVSVTVGPDVSYGIGWLDVRNLIRKIPRVFAISHLLAPWQLITDEITAKQYRVVQISDGGRTVCVGVEWPGAGQEVVIP